MDDLLLIAFFNHIVRVVTHSITSQIEHYRPIYRLYHSVVFICYKPFVARTCKIFTIKRIYRGLTVRTKAYTIVVLVCKDVKYKFFENLISDFSEITINY